VNLYRAEEIAERLLRAMEPYCERICIAGSIRRQKPDVGDIEIVAIPRWEPRPDPANLFGESVPVNTLFADWASAAGLEWLKGFAPEGKQWVAELPEGINLDLYLPNARNWGNILLLRTGSAEFNKAIVNHAAEYGFPFRDGFVRGRDGRELEMPTERAVFELLGLEYVVPEARTGAAAVRLARRAA
jgi:DNA polymerase/3'-5' exonuclease PolX